MSDRLQLENILTGYKVGELKELAKASGITGYSKLKKAELIEVITKQLDTVDVKSLDIPEDVKEAAAFSDAVKKEEDNSSKTKQAVKRTAVHTPTPIIGVAPHVMNVKQENQPPLIPVNQPKMPSKKIYPNDLCPCGSNKKYKRCCGR